MKKAFAALAVVSFSSCATMKNATVQTGSAVKSIGSSTARGFRKAGSATIAFLTPGSDIPVVKVRPEALKNVQTGEEKAMAYQHGHGVWSSFFSGPANFVEPTLPAGAMESDAGLLPPKPE